MCIRDRYEVMQENKNSIAKERADLQELISDISHQVKTPIANLKMINNTLLEMCIRDRIIDDDRELCALIKRSVQAENIEADFCNTGKEGLQKLREQEYQLVVLDVMMPGMDGFEMLEEIRKEYSLPILMFTSKNDSISKVRGLRAGADDYLTKPFDMDELIARIASLILSLIHIFESTRFM